MEAYVKGLAERNDEMIWVIRKDSLNSINFTRCPTEITY